MKLTDYEKQMLDGKYGAPKRKAMELIVRYGNVIGAEKLCRVTWADLFCGSHSYLDVMASDDFDEVFSRMSLCATETCRLDRMDSGCICYSGVEADCTEVPKQMLMPADKQKNNLDILNRFADAGVVLSGNCIPYLTGFIPLAGEHFVSCESSAVLFINSLWGACGNGDGIEASFCAAVCGRTPLSGKHLPENRIGTDVIRIESDPKSTYDWDVLGHAVGVKLQPRAIPVLTGDFERPDSLKLKAFFSALACAAGTEICHIPGITPEAGSIEQALGGKKPNSEICISADDTTATVLKLSGHGREKIDYITLGCPHYHIEEIRRIAGFLEGKRIQKDTRLHIWTTGSIKYTADRCGYTRIIEAAGGIILTGSCPSSRGYPAGVRTVAYDSAKQRMSAAQEIRAKLFYGSLEQCLKSAISGFWEGR
jgi:predicted aconitase